MDAKNKTSETEQRGTVTVILKGRMVSHTQVTTSNSSFYRNLVLVPAKDVYSHPSTSLPLS